MRFWFPHLVVAALVLVVAVLVLTSMEGEARRYILTDGFNGPDLSAPDTSKWEVNALHGTGEVYVGNGLLHTNMNGHQHCDAVMLNDFTNENVTLTVDFKVVRDVERSVETRRIMPLSLFRWLKLKKVIFQHFLCKPQQLKPNARLIF